MEKEAAGAGTESDGDGAIPAEEAEEGVIAAADDCERWRMAMSAGLLRRSWLLDERWPGVCDRGSGGARSWASPVALSSSEGGGRVSVGDTGAIFCERTTLMFCGGGGSLSRAAPLAWSAIDFMIE